MLVKKKWIDIDMRTGKWKGKKKVMKQTCLTSPFQMQWAAKNPITAGTIYKRAG